MASILELLGLQQSQQPQQGVSGIEQALQEGRTGPGMGANINRGMEDFIHQLTGGMAGRAQPRQAPPFGLPQLPRVHPAQAVGIPAGRIARQGARAARRGLKGADALQEMLAAILNPMGSGARARRKLPTLKRKKGLGGLDRMMDSRAAEDAAVLARINKLRGRL